MSPLLSLIGIIIMIKSFSSTVSCPEDLERESIDRDIKLKTKKSPKDKNEKYTWSKRDFRSTLNSYYSNFSIIDFRISDFEVLFRKKIITENQAVLIWENLLNTKTERNLEWMEYNKIKSSQSSGSNEPKKEYSSRYWQYLSLLFNTNEFKFQSIYSYIGGIFCYFLSKFLFKFPKINLVFLTFCLIINIMNTFSFYDKKFYFTSCISLCSFISNIYFMYLNIAILAGEKDVNCSIFYVKHFKTQNHFYMKIFICGFLLSILIYLTSFSLRFHLNYIIAFFLLEKIREMIRNYCSLCSLRIVQPVNDSVSLIFGLIIFIFTNIVYYSNSAYSYELNSFLFVNNAITFYYFYSLDKYVYIQRNYLGRVYLECEKLNDRRDKNELFEELKKQVNIEKFYRSDIITDSNLFDFALIFLCIQFLLLGFLLSTYFYILLSFFFLHTIHKNCMLFLSIKHSRILTNSILLVYLFLISNLSNISFNYINEIVAIYDQKFLDALVQLIKIFFYILLGGGIYLSEDFADLFNIYNYSSYRYLFREISFPNNTKVQKVLNQVYKFSQVIGEILNYDVNIAIARVQAVLETMNDGSSNINEYYIETLLTRDSSNFNTFYLIIDYLMLYFTLFVLKDIFSNNSNSFLYLTYLIHRLGIYCKIFLLYLEYSKTSLQKNVYVLLTLLFMERLNYYPENDNFDIYIIHFLKNGALIFYLVLYKGNYLMNFLLLILFILYCNAEVESILRLPFVISIVLSKIIIQMCRMNKGKYFIYGIMIMLCIITFSLMNYELIKLVNISIRLFFIKVIKIDIVGLFEKFIYVGQSKNDYIEIKIINNINLILRIIRSTWNF